MTETKYHSTSRGLEELEAGSGEKKAGIGSAHLFPNSSFHTTPKLWVPGEGLAEYMGMASQVCGLREGPQRRMRTITGTLGSDLESRKKVV